MKAQKYVKPFKVGIIFCFEPVFAAIFAFSIGGEEFLWRKFWGGFLIFISMVVVELDKVVNIGKNYIIFRKEVL
jgi:drug/metabolite transporter (DMT)-like permease